MILIEGLLSEPITILKSIHHLISCCPKARSFALAYVHQNPPFKAIRLSRASPRGHLLCKFSKFDLLRVGDNRSALLFLFLEAVNKWLENRERVLALLIRVTNAAASKAQPDLGIAHLLLEIKQTVFLEELFKLARRFEVDEGLLAARRAP